MNIQKIAKSTLFLRHITRFRQVPLVKGLLLASRSQRITKIKIPSVMIQRQIRKKMEKIILMNIE